jgi:hypothetical protein
MGTGIKTQDSSPVKGFEASPRLVIRIAGTLCLYSFKRIKILRNHRSWERCLANVGNWDPRTNEICATIASRKDGDSCAIVPLNTTGACLTSMAYSVVRITHNIIVVLQCSTL